MSKTLKPIDAIKLVSKIISEDRFGYSATEESYDKLCVHLKPDSKLLAAIESLNIANQTEILQKIDVLKQRARRIKDMPYIAGKTVIGIYSSDVNKIKTMMDTILNLQSEASSLIAELFGDEEMMDLDLPIPIVFFHEENETCCISNTAQIIQNLTAKEAVDCCKLKSNDIALDSIADFIAMSIVMPEEYKDNCFVFFPTIPDKNDSAQMSLVHMVDMMLCATKKDANCWKKAVSNVTTCVYNAKEYSSVIPCGKRDNCGLHEEALSIGVPVLEEYARNKTELDEMLIVINTDSLATSDSTDEISSMLEAIANDYRMRNNALLKGMEDFSREFSHLLTAVDEFEQNVYTDGTYESMKTTVPLHNDDVCANISDTAIRLIECNKQELAEPIITRINNMGDDYCKSTIAVFVNVQDDKKIRKTLQSLYPTICNDYPLMLQRAIVRYRCLPEYLSGEYVNNYKNDVCLTPYEVYCLGEYLMRIEADAILPGFTLPQTKPTGPSKSGSVFAKYMKYARAEMKDRKTEAGQTDESSDLPDVRTELIERCKTIAEQYHEAAVRGRCIEAVYTLRSMYTHYPDKKQYCIDVLSEESLIYSHAMELIANNNLSEGNAYMMMAALCKYVPALEYVADIAYKRVMNVKKFKRQDLALAQRLYSELRAIYATNKKANNTSNDERYAILLYYSGAYDKAFDLLSSVDTPMAHYYIALMYRKGKGRAKDIDKALEHALIANETESEKMQKFVNGIQDEIAERDKKKVNAYSESADYRTTTDVSYDSSYDGCILTTATCEVLGKPDDCEELTALRAYRDNSLVKTPEGLLLRDEYYRIAPMLIAKIANEPDKKEIYESLYSEYIRPCCDQLAAGNEERAKRLYVEAVLSLCTRYNVKLDPNMLEKTRDMFRRTFPEGMPY